MNKKKSPVILIYLFCFLLTVLVYINFIYLPLNNQIAQLDQKHTDTVNQILYYEEQKSKRADIEKNIAELQSKIEQESTNATVTARTGAEDIDSACKAVGIVPKSVDMSEETVDTSKKTADGRLLSSVSVDLTVACNNEQLKNLLDYFENKSKGAYYVNHVSYKNGTTGSEIAINLTLSYFSAQEAKK